MLNYQFSTYKFNILPAAYLYFSEPLLSTIGPGGL